MSLKEITLEKIKHQKTNLCRFCGNFSAYTTNGGNFIPRSEKPPFSEKDISLSWVKAYEKYAYMPPQLGLIYKEN
ncbi:MAG TPA: hypothetical protein PLD55_12055 [bacterium]|nr:hypothetical protein [bacterium]HOG44680.1 hypothetical protein [bacterium]HPG36022.1 hypothetical protein [bacterium]HPM47020.1 hypothetical protein [bacterium]HPV21439.1 hypothetical protein [bacterium]